MAIDRENVPVCPGVSIGMPMSISFEGIGTVKSTLIGMEYGQYLIVKLPPMPDIPAKLYQKNHLVIRYFHDGNAYGFRSTLIGLIKDPVRLFIIAYPETIESLNLRRDERHVCLIPARVGATAGSGVKVDLSGLITNISYGGCSFECANPTDIALAGLTVGSIIELSFRFSNEEAWQVLNGEVRMWKADPSRLMIGLRYSPDLSKVSQHNAISAIQSFIDGLRL